MDTRGGGDDPALASIDGGGSSSTGGSIVGSAGPEDGPTVVRLKYCVLRSSKLWEYSSVCARLGLGLAIVTAALACARKRVNGVRGAGRAPGPRAHAGRPAAGVLEGFRSWGGSASARTGMLSAREVDRPARRHSLSPAAPLR